MQGKFSGEGLDSMFFPIPSVFLAFRIGSEPPIVFPSAWVGLVSHDPVVLSAAFRGSAPEFLTQGGEFAVNLPDEDLIREFSRCGGMDIKSLRFVEEAMTGATLIQGCPVRIECRCSSFESHFGECYVRGEVAAVHRGELSVPIKAAKDIFQIDPFAPAGHPFAAGNLTAVRGIFPQTGFMLS